VLASCSDFGLQSLHDQGLIGTWSMVLMWAIQEAARSVKISTSSPEPVAHLPDSAVLLLQ
jgi:hypothetical protein